MRTSKSLRSTIIVNWQVHTYIKRRHVNSKGKKGEGELGLNPRHLHEGR